MSWQLPEVPYYYLAGPMRGYEDFNFPAFKRIATELRRRGYTIVSPAEKDESDGFDASGTDGGQEALDAQAFDIDAALTADILIIANKRCKGVIAMEGWEQSSGARAETAYAWATGRVVYRYFEPILALANGEWRDSYEDLTNDLVEIHKPHLHTTYGEVHDMWTWTVANARTA